MNMTNTKTKSNKEDLPALADGSSGLYRLLHRIVLHIPPMSSWRFCF